jgi:gluconokinase
MRQDRRRRSGASERGRTEPALDGIVLLMGVAGAGKTTIGKSLAAHTGAELIDADELHPPGNVAKMAAGRALTDADRTPWLARVREEIGVRRRAGAATIVACSALKASYRRTLLAGLPAVRVVHLRATPAELERRLRRRRGHFFDPALLADQLATLEEPADASTIDTEGGIEATLAAVLAALATDSAAAAPVQARERRSRWSVYVVRAADGTLYSGVTTDVARRLAEHAGGARGSRYLRGRAPLELVFARRIGERGLAQRVENRLKRLGKREKEELVCRQPRRGQLLALLGL